MSSQKTKETLIALFCLAWGFAMIRQFPDTQREPQPVPAAAAPAQDVESMSAEAPEASTEA